MKNLSKVIGFITLVMLLQSCAVKKPMTQDFYQNNNTIGVVYVIDTISVYKEGGQGLLDMAVTQGKRFHEPLAVVDDKLNVEQEVRMLYDTLFQNKGKRLQEIEYTYNPENLEKFDNPASSDKLYHKYDLRGLKDKGISELLIVQVRYGLLVSYYGMIETGKVGYCRIDSEVVNLSDNAYIFKDFSEAQEKIDGKWKTPPAYENLTNAIDKAVENAIVMEYNKLNP